ncbi:hypothetical protein PR048_013298 [Dryococelus australis]|uniref:Uncharacterized protein n=1 Tax=Dryococelus australis TaxID=614101 RepID=A0ABQ9HRR8_9NEOP|nr:hypothetical protein PR048_013298 [Dryococelus australis]
MESHNMVNMESLDMISEEWVQKVCNAHFITGLCEKENCGGDHCSHRHEEQNKSVKAFIESLVPLESHYCRNNHYFKKYLESSLTVTKLNSSYNNSCYVEVLSMRNNARQTDMIKPLKLNLIATEGTSVDSHPNGNGRKRRVIMDRLKLHLRLTIH